jgi:hypothetical protein
VGRYTDPVIKNMYSVVCTMWRRESSVQSVHDAEKKGFPLLRLLFNKNIVEGENIVNLIYNKLQNLISSTPLRAAQYEDSSYKIKTYRWNRFFKSSLYWYCRNLAIIALIHKRSLVPIHY